MQLIPRYLLNNTIIIVTNETGFDTEYMPVYSRQIKAYRGIDNKIQFKIVNADQKAMDITDYMPTFVAFDETKRQVIRRVGTIQDGAKGKFEINITENDLLNIQRQYLRYNIYLTDLEGDNHLTFADSNFDNNATLFVDDYAFPGPAEPHTVSTFVQDNTEWISEAISAEPALNGNEALHTAAIYTNDYIGDATLEATLDVNVNEDTSWAPINTITFDGTETMPTYFNFRGVYNYLRFKTTASPNDTITKILVRN